MIDKLIFKFSGIKSMLVGLAGGSILQALLIIGQSVTLALAISRLWAGQPLKGQVWLVCVFVACFAGRHGLGLLKQRKLDAFGGEKARELRLALTDKIFRLGPRLVQKAGSGSLVVAAVEGVSHVENYICIIISKLPDIVAIPIPILITVFYFDPLSGAILVGVFPIVFLFMILFGNAAKEKADRQYEGYKVLSNHFMDSLRGLETLKFLGRSKAHGKSVYAVGESYRKATMNTLKTAILSTFALDFFTTLSIAVVAVFLGLRLLKGEMELFPAFVVLILCPEYFQPIRQFADDYHATLDGKNALKDIRRILDKREPAAGQEGKGYGTTSRIKVSGLTFTHEGEERPTITDVDIQLAGTGTIVIVGKTGAGKTTLIDLLGGFLEPDGGQPFEIDGERFHTLNQKKWQENLIYIPQYTHIFHGTLEENIKFYCQEATREEVAEAAQKAGLSEFIQTLEKGLDTRVGEQGRGLSGGQAQRVALARAFLQPERSVILLDEPTSGLDIETELEIKEDILRLCRGKLVFLSTHRLHWAKDADLILIVDGGKVVSQGTLAEIEQKPEYGRIAAEMRGEL